VGGLGSGRPRSLTKRALVEDSPVLDVNALKRKGVLEPGLCSTADLSLGVYGALPVWVVVAEAADYIEVSLDFLAIRAQIALTYTRGTLGGERVWFVCPKEGCGRRVVKLYLIAREHFGCRECSGMSYSSQGYRPARRAVEKAKQIRSRLGGDASLGAPFPPRPAYMRKRTYARLRREAEDAEREFLADVRARCLRSELSVLSLERRFANRLADGSEDKNEDQ
jgi:hypothetical protein